MQINTQILFYIFLNYMDLLLFVYIKHSNVILCTPLFIIYFRTFFIIISSQMLTVILTTKGLLSTFIVTMLELMFMPLLLEFMDQRLGIIFQSFYVVIFH